MDATTSPARTVLGSVRMRRTGRLRFPIEELVDDEGLVASLGRNSSFWIFFGKGRRVRLADGTEWRIGAATSARHIVPIVRSGDRLIASSGPLHAKRTYGINGKDWDYTLIPLGRVGIRRPDAWALQRHEEQVGELSGRRRTFHSSEPVPTAAVLLAFTLLVHGTPGEADLVPSRL
jgi:hypothetical protein